jgi:hypothetical protein
VTGDERGDISVSLRILAVSAGIAVLALSFMPLPAAAKGTSLFASESNAKSVCGEGKVVWAVIDSGKYYPPGTPGYEWGKGEGKGAYTCEKTARARGWHAAKAVQ